MESSNILGDIIYYIIITILGIVVLLIPYDKWESIFPKAPSKAVTKTCGVVAIVCGIVLIALTMTGIL